MNCEGGPTPTPCNQCQSCREITVGSAVDVFEIDGASNNSVDQVRELRENVKYMPAHSPHKIYIIDEVHMLSIAAFNALLKTLEEPPDHVMFIFATTEPRKIPITILSRCQRHDFRRIETDAISDYLAKLCREEEMTVSEESLGLMAQEAGGSMRDALSLLDQVMACAEGPIDYPLVLEILGLVDRKMIFGISDAVLLGNVTDLLDRLDEIYGLGHDMKKLYEDLVTHFRNMLVVKMGKNVEKLVDIPGHEIALMTQQVKDTPISYLQQIVDLLFREDATIRSSAQPKLALEMAFIRLFQVPPSLPIDALIEKLEALRQGFHGSATAQGPGGEARPVRNGSLGGAVAGKSPGDADADTGHPVGSRDDDDPSPGDSAADAATIWKRVTDVVSERYPSLAANLSRCQVKSVSGERIELEAKGNGFTVNMLRRNKNIAILRKVYHELFGEEIEFLIAADTRENETKTNNGNHESRLKNDALRHPRVADAIEIFDGKVLDVKLLP